MGLLNIVSNLAGTGFKERLVDFVGVEATEDERSFVMSDGSLMSLFEIDGSRITLANEDLEEVIGRLRVRLSSYLTMPGHVLQFCFMRDPAEARSDLERIVARTRRTSAMLGIDVDDILEERVRNLPQAMSLEMNLLAVYTSPAVMSSDEVKSSNEEKKAQAGLHPPLQTAQAPGKAFDGVYTRHNSLIDAMVRDFDAVGQSMAILDTTEALRRIRGFVYPDRLANRRDWTPRIFGEKAARVEASGRKPARIARMPETPSEMDGRNFSHLGEPLLNRQMVSDDAHAVDATIMRIGDMIVSGFDVAVAPEILTPFDELIRQASDAPDRIRWRASFLVESGGLQGDAFKKILVNVLTFLAPQNNRRIRDAYRELAELNGVDDTVVRLRMNFAAWAEIGEEKALRRSVSALRRAVERWGNVQTNALAGDPLACVMSSVPGAGCGSTAPVGAAPLADVLAMLPLNRAASPWKEGSLALSSPDGKLWPYQPGSSLQTTWCDIMVGTPGSGKSVLLNTINLAATLTPQTVTTRGGRMLLPRIAIIDVGPSSSGLISLLQDALPADRRHEVVYSRIKNSRNFAINPFDTQIGLRHPLSAERQFLVNFLSILCTPSDAEAPYDGMSGLIQMTVDELYRLKSDEVSPHRYLQGESMEVDAALKRLNIAPDEATTWFEIVDLLVEHEMLHEAALAHRNAMPTLGDVVAAAQADRIVDLYGQMNTPTGEPIVRALQRMISAAISEFPVISHPTRFDLSNARIAALDLDEVTARGTGPGAYRQTALMFMIARQSLCRDFFLDEAEIRALDIPAMYHELHGERARANKQLPKRICMDEFHRTGGLPGIRAQVLQDIREGRKHNIQVALASQLLDDFDENITALATSVWFCNANSEAAIRHAVDSFGLNHAAGRILRYQLNGPTSKGAPVFAIFKMKTGEIRQMLVSRLGPIEVWSFSTTSEDVALRSRLYELLGSKAARLALARRFPGGTAKPEIERRKARLEDEGARVDDRMEGGLIEQLAKEIADQAAKVLFSTGAQSRDS